MPNNNIETRQLDILSSINRNLERIATALENIDMKMCNTLDPGLEWVEDGPDPIDYLKKRIDNNAPINPIDSETPLWRSFEDCMGCKHLNYMSDPIAMKMYCSCMHYRRPIKEISLCTAKEIKLK